MAPTNHNLNTYMATGHINLIGFEEEFTKRMFKVVKLFDRTLDRLVILPIFPVSYPRLQHHYLGYLGRALLIFRDRAVATSSAK